MPNILSSIMPNVVPGRKRIPDSRPSVVIVKVDGTPDATDGVDLPIGSIAVWDNGGVGRIYFKTGEGVTDWTLWVTEPNTMRDQISFIGSGVGASKTTTVIDGVVIAEEMRIGDELYAVWDFPLNLDKTVPIVVEVTWYLNATEIGKFVSGEIAYTFFDGIPGTIDDIMDTLIMTDEPVPTPAFTPETYTFPININDYMEGLLGNHMAIRLTRTASSNEPTAHPRINHVTVTYTPLYPSLA